MRVCEREGSVCVGLICFGSLEEQQNTRSLKTSQNMIRLEHQHCRFEITVNGWLGVNRYNKQHQH